jgi:hypothetical protein
VLTVLVESVCYLLDHKLWVKVWLLHVENVKEEYIMVERAPKFLSDVLWRDCKEGIWNVLNLITQIYSCIVFLLLIDRYLFCSTYQPKRQRVMHLTLVTTF